MDIFTVRQKLRTTRISDIPLRVTFYARVSTDSDEQLNSLDNQIGYYRDYIAQELEFYTTFDYESLNEQEDFPDDLGMGMGTGFHEANGLGYQWMPRLGSTRMIPGSAMRS